MPNNNPYVIGFDISTATIGISVMEITNNKLELKLLTHVSPKVIKKDVSDIESLFIKSEIFKEQFIEKHKDYLNSINIKTIVIEEPLLMARNIYTCATLIRFNTLISKILYDEFNVVPEYISSYDARKFAFPELMGIRKQNKKGELLKEKELKVPVLFGDYPYDVDKKQIIWEKVNQMFQKDINWLFNKKGDLKKECFDLSDAVTVTVAWFNRRYQL